MRAFHFVRHGATELNLRGLRCGGDLDVDLADLGRAQSHEAAARIRAMNVGVRRIITSGLARARQTAGIISEAFGGIPVTIEPLLNERRLGEWNARPVAETEGLLSNRITPPAGESEDAFVQRIAGAVEKLAPQLVHDALVVSSSGVGRAIHTLLGGQGRLRLTNCQIVRFSLMPDAFPLKIPQRAP